MGKLLTNENIAETIRLANDFCKNNKIDNASSIQATLALEETLIAYQKYFGDDISYSCRFIKMLGSCRMILTVGGPGYNPLENDNDLFQSSLLSSMLRKMILQPSYTYLHGINEINFPLKKRSTSGIPGGGNTIALILGLILGFIFIQLPSGTRINLSANVIDPIYSTIIGILLGITIPFIFVSLLTCIASMGDINTLKSLGMNIISRIARMALLTTAVGLLVSLWLFPLEFANSSHILTQGNFLQRILALFPTNMVIPFLRNNSIQIVFIAAFLGVCALILGDKINNFKVLLSETNTLLVQAMDIIAKLNYPLIVLSIISLMHSTNKQLFVSLLKVVLACVLTNLVVIAIYIIYVAIRHKRSPFKFLKTMMPAITIGFFTASSSTAMAKNYDLAENRAHIDSEIHDLWNPLTFALASSTVVFLTVGTIFIASYNHVAVNLIWFIMAFILIFQMNFAAPKVQGGVIATFTLLFSQLGLPTDSLGLLSAANVLVMNLNVGCNMITRELDLYDFALTHNAIKDEDD